MHIFCQFEAYKFPHCNSGVAEEVYTKAILGFEPRMSWARILTHLQEAEKSTFRKELSFQRSESTLGLLSYSFCLMIEKILFCAILTDLKSGVNAYN